MIGHSQQAAGQSVSRIRLRSLARLLFGQLLCLLLLVLVLGWFTDVHRRAFPPGIEDIQSNRELYGGWLPSPHPLGVADGKDGLELLLTSLSRTLTGPLLIGIPVIFLGGLWGAWAAFARGIWDRVLTILAISLDSVPRIILFAILLGALTRTIPGLTPVDLVIVFAVFQVPAVAMALRGRIRSIVRDGYVEGLISLGFPSRTIVLRDLLLRHCGGELKMQYVARATELVALQTALSFAFSFTDGSVGCVLRALDNTHPGLIWLLLAGSLALYLFVLHAAARMQWRRLLPGCYDEQSTTTQSDRASA